MAPILVLLDMCLTCGDGERGERACAAVCFCVRVRAPSDGGVLHILHLQQLGGHQR
jgi:hypothetical protein